jgi:positive regulator of sigma E activity
VNASQEFSVGSEVAVELPAREVLRAAMLAYGLPLLGLGVGGLLAALVSPGASDALVLSGAGFGLSLGVAFSRKRARVALLQPAAVALRLRD